MSFLDNILTSTTSQLRVLLAFIILAATYTFARIFFAWRLVDKEGNRIPDGPVGLPVIGAFMINFTLWRWIISLTWKLRPQLQDPSPSLLIILS